MTSRRAFAAALAALLLATPAAANETIVVRDAYARSASPVAKTGAAYFVIENHSGRDDRLVAASSDAAARVELHTHVDAGDGVLQMRQIEDGIAVPAGAEHTLGRGGDHLMFMGLPGPWEDGQTLSVTLTFEQAGDMVLDIPVDQQRQPDDAGGGHGGHGGTEAGN